MWERYCRGVNAIVYVPCAGAASWLRCRCRCAVFAWGKADGVTGTRRFVVDAADQNNLEIARSELHNLLKKQDGKENPLAGIPLLVRLACLQAHKSTTDARCGLLRARCWATRKTCRAR